MSSPVGGISGIGTLLPTEQTQGTPLTSSDTGASADAGTFEGVLTRAVLDANTADKTAAEKIEALATGASDDLHGTMISAKEAEISIKLVGSIRNKVLDAFHEIWRTSV